MRRLSAFALAALAAVPLAAQRGAQPIDSAYTARILELTPTHPQYKFITEMVDYLPASATVPTPLKVLGYVPGTIGRLAYAGEAAKYYRAVAAATPRVKVITIGKSEEGREIVAGIVADSATIAHLDDYKAILRKLTDPRGLSAAERADLVKRGKPIYLLSGSLHSPETGSPEAMIEMLYRLAVDEGDQIRKIRENVITMIIPVWEVDGRDHYIDFYQQNRKLNVPATAGLGLPYWGKYVAHDNNRDGMALTLELTRGFLRTFLDWRPTVTHDLHESVPFLYTSTGTGPYNTEYDAIQIDEWFQLSYTEITELTRRGLPGVFTYQFYDGWAPNYGLSIANLHNSIGRFYETYTSSGADCINNVQLPATATSVQWYRPSPPVNGIKWCIRTNLNYQQSGVLIALRQVAEMHDRYLENAVTKAERTIARGQREAPYAFIIPRGQRHAAEAADMVNLFRTQGTEVHEASAAFTLAAGKDSLKIAAGDWIVRLDQPYTQFPRTVLALQSFKPSDPQPYDDTGWTMDLLRHVTTLKIADSSVFTRPMRLLTADAAVSGTVAGAGGTLVVPHLGDWRSSILPWKVAGARVRVADSTFEIGGTKYPAGTFIVADAPRDSHRRLGTRHECRRHRRRDCGVARADAAAHRHHALVDLHAGRGLGALRLRPPGRAIHDHLRAGDQDRRSARPVRRGGVPARRRQLGHAAQRPLAGGTGRAMEEVTRHARPWHAGRDRRCASRHGFRRPAGAAQVRRARRPAVHRGRHVALHCRHGLPSAGDRRRDADAARPRRCLPR